MKGFNYVPRITLQRITDGDCTFGVFLRGRSAFVPICVTLEPPWQHNMRNISCIPAGEYVVKKHFSRKFGDCFHVLDVPNRSGILIHAGNYVQDTRGCILVGKTFRGESIGTSKATLSDLLFEFSDGFVLNVKDLTYRG